MEDEGGDRESGQLSISHSIARSLLYDEQDSGSAGRAVHLKVTLVDALPRFFPSAHASISLLSTIHPRVPGNCQFRCNNPSIGPCLLPWDQKSRSVGSVKVRPLCVFGDARL